MSKLTAAQYIKASGLPSVAYVADQVKRTPATIHNWYNNEPELFHIVVSGCVKQKEGEDMKAAVERILRDYREEKK